MEDGRRLTGRQVVLAVEAPAAREFLTRLDPAAAADCPPQAASSVGAAFEPREDAYAGAPSAERRPGIRRAPPGLPPVPDHQRDAARGDGGPAHPADVGPSTARAA